MLREIQTRVGQTSLTDKNIQFTSYEKDMSILLLFFSFSFIFRKLREFDTLTNNSRDRKAKEVTLLFWGCLYI